MTHVYTYTHVHMYAHITHTYMHNDKQNFNGIEQAKHKTHKVKWKNNQPPQAEEGLGSNIGIVKKRK